MKISYIVALLMIVILVGCATQEEAAPAEPAPPVAPVEPAVPVEEAAPAEETAEEGAAIPAEVDQATIDRLKAACEAGAVKICLVLKNVHGIDWPPAVAEEPETTEEPATEEPPITEGATE